MRRSPKSIRPDFAGLPLNRGKPAKSIALAASALLLAFLACTPATPTVDVSRQQTEVAEGVEQTVRAGEVVPTATTETPPTAQPPTETSTPTSPPTATATESPWIEGSIERAAFDPAAGWGAPDVHDNFSGTHPEFELDNTFGVAHGWYEDGRYNITYPVRGWWTWYSGATSIMDFYVDVVVYNADTCADRDSAGLLYRYRQSTDWGLMFGLTCSGGYFNGVSPGGLGATGGVCRITSPAPTGPSDIDCDTNWVLPTSEFIDTGPGAVNRIGVKAVGQNVTLYINGHQVESMVIPLSIVYWGEFGLYLGAGQEDNARVSFDDFSIWFNP